MNSRVFSINRKKDLDIIKYDHGQMKEYLTEVFSSGYEEGVKAASGEREVPELIGLEDELLSIRGIGSAKARSICEKVKEFLERKIKTGEKGVND